jgi:hypothetical protein
MQSSDAAALRDALQRQADELSAVIDRFGRTRQRVSAERSVGWHGVAQLAYSVARWQLAAQLDAASDQLDRALSHTRRALDSLSSRVG